MDLMFRSVLKKFFQALVLIAFNVFFLIVLPKEAYAVICDCHCGAFTCQHMCPPGVPPGSWVTYCEWNECEACPCDNFADCENCSSCGGGGACFTGDTPIRMADNTQKPIKDVQVGEEVKSFDPNTGEITNSEVTKVYRHGAEEIKGYWLLTLESGKQIKVTPEHPILVLDENGQRVWRTVEEVEEGDYALVYDESGDIVQKANDTEKAEAVLDQQQSQSSNPTLLQALFPPLWLLSKVFKN